MGGGKGGERMDDTTQQSASVPQDTMTQTPTGDGTAMPNLSDLAGMTPPPAPVAPSMDGATDAISTQQSEASPAETGTQELTKDDYSYAEDILDEILDSLDRIEAKVEAIEKKLG